jgi:potassium channel subfamily K, other eukaryote
LYLPLSVGAAGEIISGIATAMLKRRQRKAYESQFEGKLTVEHLRAMDTDGSGSVDKAEYCFFMLKEMGLVSKDDLDELYRQFDALDVAKSGLLDREDLTMMAKLRGAEVLD